MNGAQTFGIIHHIIGYSFYIYEFYTLFLCWLSSFYSSLKQSKWSFRIIKRRWGLIGRFLWWVGRKGESKLSWLYISTLLPSSLVLIFFYLKLESLEAKDAAIKSNLNKILDWSDKYIAYYQTLFLNIPFLHKTILHTTSFTFGEFHPTVPDVFWNHPACLIFVFFHPFMSFHILKAHSLGRVTIQYSADEINDLGTQVNRELDLNFKYLIVCLIFICIGFKWCLACT